MSYQKPRITSSGPPTRSCLRKMRRRQRPRALTTRAAVSECPRRHAIISGVNPSLSTQWLAEAPSSRAARAAVASPRAAAESSRSPSPCSLRGSSRRPAAAHDTHHKQAIPRHAGLPPNTARSLPPPTVKQARYHPQSRPATTNQTLPKSCTARPRCTLLRRRRRRCSARGPHG